MEPGIETMHEQDLSDCLRLWSNTQGVCLNESDSIGNLIRFLRRNPRMSFVARTESGHLVGAVLCGHDGRRGYLHHLAVNCAYRRKRIGAALVECCLEALSTESILKCAIYVLDSNIEGRSFWSHLGWNARSDFQVLQKGVGQPKRCAIYSEEGCRI